MPKSKDTKESAGSPFFTWIRVSTHRPLETKSLLTWVAGDKYDLAAII